MGGVFHADGRSTTCAPLANGLSSVALGLSGVAELKSNGNFGGEDKLQLHRFSSLGKVPRLAWSWMERNWHFALPLAAQKTRVDNKEVLNRCQSP